MKLNTVDFGRKVQFPVILAAGTLPFPLLMIATVNPGCLAGALILAGIYVVLAALCLVLPGKVRFAAGLLSSAAMMAAGMLLLQWQGAVYMLLIPLLYVALLLVFLSMGAWPKERELPAWAPSAGIVLHIIGWGTHHFTSRVGDMTYEQINPILTGAFLVFGVLSMFAMNRNSMYDAGAQGKHTPLSMRRKNRILTMGLTVIVLILSLIPAIIDAISKVWDMIVSAVFALIAWLGSLIHLQQTGGDSGGGGKPEMGGLPAGEAGWFAVLMQNVIAVVAILAVAVLVIVGLRILYKKLKKLFAYLMKRLAEFAASSSEDYVDEITDTRELEDHVSLFRERFRRKHNPLKGIDESALSPVERVRYHYRRLVLKHSEWESARTARETLPESAAGLYERARYSDHEVTAAEAEDFARRAKEL